MRPDKVMTHTAEGRGEDDGGRRCNRASAALPIADAKQRSAQRHLRHEAVSDL
jgi:hypothetical protein